MPLISMYEMTPAIMPYAILLGETFKSWHEGRLEGTVLVCQGNDEDGQKCGNSITNVVPINLRNTSRKRLAR
jgi:hypothetical protein